MIKLYNRLVRNCKSENMYNRMHIKLENYMTPEQFDKLKSDFKIYNDIAEINEKSSLKKIVNRMFPKFYKILVYWKNKIIYSKIKIDAGSKINFNQHTQKWINRIDNYFKQTNKNYPEPFIKKRINRYTIHFTSKDQTTKTKDKTLLVCFTGNAQRMMMPLAVFLQSLDSKTTDVIYIKNPKEKGYMSGLPGYDKSFEEMLDRLGSLPFDNYKHVVGMGTSGGAYAILLLSLRYSFDAVMAVGPIGPDDFRLIKELGKNTENFIEDFTNNTHKLPSIYLVYGANDLKDKDNIYKWKKVLKEVNIIKIDDIGHVALRPLIQNGKFADLLSKTIYS